MGVNVSAVMLRDTGRPNIGQLSRGTSRT